MIIKKISLSQEKSKSASIRDIIHYIRSHEDSEKKEKILYTSSRGFIFDDPEVQKKEMQALALDNPRSKTPVTHYVISWREGEQPTKGQAEEAVDIIMSEFKIDTHQAVYALHKNTDNFHLHLLVSRVNPDTGKMVKIGGGFEIEAAHRAIARIEFVQGWQSERNGRYRVLEDGTIVKNNVTNRNKKVKAKIQDKERETGEKSAVRLAQEKAAHVISAAQTWAELHAGLAAIGMKYVRKGSGAVIFVGDIAVKASDISRAAALGKLQKKLGQYEAHPDGLVIAPQPVPEPIDTDSQDIGWSDYIAGRQKHYADKKADRDALRARHAEERDDLYHAQRQERQERLSGTWTGRGRELNVERSVLAAQQARAKAALLERQKRERRDLGRRYRPWPSFELWLRRMGDDESADMYRAGQAGRDAYFTSGSDTDTDTSLTKTFDIRDFTYDVIAGEVLYYADGPDVAFADHGKYINIYTHSDSSILAALQVAQMKWCSVHITGSDEFKSQCVKLAVRHGIKVKNMELQDEIEREREKWRASLGWKKGQAAPASSSSSSHTSHASPAPRPVPVPVPPVPSVSSARQGKKDTGKRQDEQDTPVSAVSAPSSPPARHPRLKLDDLDDLGEAGELYREAYLALQHRVKGVDISRIDAHIAVRLRLAKLSQSEIADIIETCAPLMQRGTDRNWHEYARRAAAWPWTPIGEGQTYAAAAGQDEAQEQDGQDRQDDVRQEQQEQTVEDVEQQELQELQGGEALDDVDEEDEEEGRGPRLR